MHRDQYLHLDSNNFITTRNSGFSTLAFRAKVVCSNQPTLQQEIDHIRKALLVFKISTMGPSIVYSQNSITGTTSKIHKQLPVTNTTTPATMDPTIKKHFHCGTLHKKAWGNVQEDLQ